MLKQNQLIVRVKVNESPSGQRCWGRTKSFAKTKSTKKVHKKSAKKVYKQKSAEKYTLKNIRQQRLDLKKKLNTDSKERSVT